MLHFLTQFPVIHADALLFIAVVARAVKLGAEHPVDLFNRAFVQAELFHHPETDGDVQRHHRNRGRGLGNDGFQHSDIGAAVEVADRIAKGVIDLDDILIDLKAGVSGPGRSLKENLLHAELSGGTHSYSAGGKHRHLGEFDQEFSKIAGRPVLVQFTPHLLPMNRGILATTYVKGDPATVHATLQAAYANEPFLRVLPFGALPSTRDIAGSNFCHIGVIGDRIPGRTVVIAVLDNLTKGSSGQALQNANLMLGIEETAGLGLAPMFP